MAAMRIVPRLDEVENGGFGFALRRESVPNEQLAFERGVEAFIHRIVVAVTTRTHRWLNACRLATLREGDRRVLRALIGVVNDSERLASKDGHLERVDHELFAHMVSHRPADDATTKDVENHGEVQETAPRRNVRDIGDPQLIGSVGREATLDEIWCRLCVTIADRRNRRATTRSP